MKNPAPLLVLLAVVSGSVSAWVVAGWRSSGASRGSAPATVGALRGAEEVDVGELRRELGRLELANQDLLARVEQLENRPLAPARSEFAAVAPPSERRAEESIGDDTRSMLLSTELPASVRTALKDIRAEERAEEERQREVREAARREERLVRLQQELGLSNPQVTDLRTWMIDSRTARQELERQRDAGGERELYKSERQAQRERDDANLQRILTPAQYQAWQEREQRDDERRQG